MDKVMAIKAAGKLSSHSLDGTRFKEVMMQKRAELDKANSIKPAENMSLSAIANDVVKNHDVALKTMKTFMTRTDYSPERLITIQYRTGVLFLREQMYCKTAELSATTFKNFTQMQV